MNTTKISHIAHLVEICAQAGISQVVLSPGSRNAPLVIGFDSHPKIETFVVHDERSAAFFALGLAEASGKPVAISCTSGSAPINYGPAISEAYYRDIPLLILTADRPTEWIDNGDGQTIRQKQLFHNFIKADFELPNYPKGNELLVSDEIVSRAIKTLFDSPRGPVHINIPLAEPLYDTQNLTSQPILLNQSKEKNDLSIEEKEVIQSNWKRYSKKLLLIGQLNPNEIPIDKLKPLIEDPSVAILVENTSNIQHFESICHTIDRTLTIINEDELNDFAPELLITMGGAVVSKRIKAFSRNNPPLINWRVGEFLIEEDTYKSLTQSFKVHPSVFLDVFNQLNIDTQSNFGNKWKQRDFMAETKHFEFLNSVSYSDLKAFDLILDTLPDDSNLHMANSSVVRYCQLFNPIRNVNYYSNRGVSGIDGSSSTAAGIAFNTKNRLNLLVTGDVSFFYDSNALWNSYLLPNLRIIVINNGGGGIFKIIDGPGKSKQSDYFVAPFEASIKPLCEAFNINYLKADNPEGLETVFESFYSHQSNNRPVLLEIDTKNVQNEVVLKDYFTNIHK